MSAVLDPSDASSVGAALVSALEHAGSGAAVRLIGEPERVTAATSAWVWFLQLAGSTPAAWQGPQVLRILDQGHDDMLEREVALSGRLLASSFPVASTHWHGWLQGTHPALLQQRLPGRPAIELLGTPKVRRVVRALGSLHAQLHGIAPGDFALPSLDAAGLLAGDLARRRAAISAVDPTGTWEWLNDTADRIASPPGEAPVLCHGDFHPLNALVADDGHISVVDWTDACIADRHHDVGRSIAIFWFASLIAERPIERVGLRLLRNWLGDSHRDAYEQKWGSRLDDRHLAWWQVAHLFRGWLQLGELAEGAVPDRESSTTDRLPSDLTERLLRRCIALRSQASA
jgi:aminoglycoside phosphotransferase (APT) family kinase protein